MLSVLTAIEQLTTYATDKALEWDIVRQKQNDDQSIKRRQTGMKDFVLNARLIHTTWMNKGVFGNDLWMKK